MRPSFTRILMALSAMTVILASLAACGGSGTTEGETPQVEQAPAAEAPAVDETAVLAVLAKADEMDGSVDHVVSKCPGCALAMDGSPDHALEMHGYELDFCSEGCKARFAEHAEEALLALQIPETSGQQP